MKELYISVDIEADGPVPGLFSMLSLGAAAFLDGILVDTFSINLETLPEASTDPDTMAWWETQTEAWEACHKDLVPPNEAMQKFDTWVLSVSNKNMAKPVCLAYPSGFDFSFVYYYLRKFLGRSVFGFSCLDINSYAMAILKTDFRATTKRNMPKEWFQGLPHNHVAIEDAIEQGYLFLKMKAAAEGK